MGLKAVFVVILLLVLGFFLFTTESGKKYLAAIEERLKEYVKEVPTAPAETFITLSITPDKLQGIGFTAENSIFRGKGFYKEVLAEKTLIKAAEKEIDVDVKIKRGEVTFTQEKTIRLFGSTEGLKLGEFELLPETSIDVSIEIEPIEFTLSNLQEKVIALEKISGELKGAKGTLILEDKNMELREFIGNLTYSNSTVNFIGNVTQILINGNDITKIVV